MTPAIAKKGLSGKEPKKRKDVKVVCKKIKNVKKPKKLLKSPDKKPAKNIGQITAQSKILDKIWKKSISELSGQGNLSPVHLEMLQKFEGQTVPRKKKKLFVKWVVTSLKLKKEKFLPLIEELYNILKAHSDSEMAKLSAEKTLSMEHKSRRQKLREKKLKKQLKKKLKGQDKETMEVALEEEKSRIEFHVPKANVRKQKKKHIREILKEKKLKKLGVAGNSAMEVDNAPMAVSPSKHVKFEDDDDDDDGDDDASGKHGAKSENEEEVESMEISSSAPKKKKKKKKKKSL